MEEWSIKNKMPLSIEKCCVFLGGKNNQGQKHFLFGQYINSWDVMSDFGNTQSANSDYRQHHNALITRGRRVTEIQKFTTKDPKILWFAIKTHVKLIYGASA